MKLWFLDFLILSLVMSAVILALALLSRLFGKKFAAGCRYFVWCAVIIRLCLPIGGFILPPLFEIELPASEASAKTGQTPETPSIQAETGAAQTADTYFESEAEAQVIIPSGAPVSAEETSENAADTGLRVNPDDILTLAFCVWAVTALILFSRSLISYLVWARGLDASLYPAGDGLRAVYLEAAERAKVKRPPALYVSRESVSPMLCGFFRPKIVVPESFHDSGALFGILSHELCHFRRRDLFIKLACVAAASINWFNPAAYLAVSLCRSEMELSCDESALSGMSDETRLGYAEAMLSVVKSCRNPSESLTTGYSFDKKAVKARFANILDSKVKRRGVAIIVCAVTVCAAAGMIIACGSAKTANITWDDSIFDSPMYTYDTMVRNADPAGYMIDMTHDFIREELDGILPSGDYTVKLEAWFYAGKTSTSRSNQSFYSYQVVFSVSGDIDKLKTTGDMNVTDGKLFLHPWGGTDDIQSWREMITVDTEIAYVPQTSPALTEASVAELNEKISTADAGNAGLSSESSDFPTVQSYVCWLMPDDPNNYPDELVKRLDEVGFEFKTVEKWSESDASTDESDASINENAASEETVEYAEPISDPELQGSVVEQYGLLLDMYRAGQLPNALPKEAGEPYRTVPFPDSAIPESVSWNDLTVLCRPLDDMYSYSIDLPLENGYCMRVYAYGGVTLDEIEFYYGEPGDPDIERYGFTELSLHSYYREQYQNELAKLYGNAGYTVDYQSRTQEKDFFTVSVSVEGGLYVTLRYGISRENGVESYILNDLAEFDALSATPYEFLIGNGGKGASPTELITQKMIASIDSQLLTVEGLGEAVYYSLIRDSGNIYESFGQTPYIRMKYTLADGSALDAVFTLYRNGAEYSPDKVTNADIWDDFEWKLANSSVKAPTAADDSSPAPALVTENDPGVFKIAGVESDSTEWDGGFYHLYMRTVDGFSLTPLGGCYWAPSDITLSDNFYSFKIDKKYGDETNSILRSCAGDSEALKQALDSHFSVVVDGYVKRFSKLSFNEDADGNALYTLQFSEPIDAKNSNSVSIYVTDDGESGEYARPLVFESAVPDSSDTLKVYTEMSYPVYYVESGGQSYSVALPYPNGGDGNDSLPLALLKTDGKLCLYVGMSRGRYSYLRFTGEYSGGKLSFACDKRLSLEDVIREGALISNADSVSTLDGLLGWKNSGFLYESGYDFFYDLLSGKSEIPEYNSVEISAFTVTRYVPGDDHVFYFDFTVTSSVLDALPPGKYHREIHDIRDCYMIDTADYASGAADEFAEVSEVGMLQSWFGSNFRWRAPDFGELDEYGLVVNYLVGRYGDKPDSRDLTLEALERLAEEKFGIKPTEKAIKSIEGLTYTENGVSYVTQGGLGGSYGGRVVDVTSADGITTVVYQFYLDCNELIPAKKVAYRFGENEVWLGCEVLEDDGYSPLGLM